MTAPAPAEWVVEGMAVAVRHSSRSRRFALKLDPLAGPVLVVPKGASLTLARQFLDRHGDWLRNRLAARPARIDFVPGARVPLHGQDHVIRSEPKARRGVWIEDGHICVSGREEFAARRVRDFLKEETRRRVCPQAFDLSARLGRVPARVTVRDLKSRWGSCSSVGDLSFAWRLVLAPPEPETINVTV